MADTVERKLTTIMATDAVGYSRLMEVDEVGTLERLKAYRTALAALIGRHRGRLVNTWGDAELVEFASVVEAVLCAIEIQRELAERNAGLAADRQLVYRIGINLGDVMVEDGDLYGEGVNVAARLQSLAEPGGILLSGPAYDQVRHKLGVRFAFLGDRRVKNLAEPVPVWRIDVGETAARAGHRAASPRDGARRRPNEAPTDDAPPAEESADGMPDRPTRWDGWLDRLPKQVVGLGALTALLLAINLLTGHGDIWFFWPAAGIGLAMAVRAVFAARDGRTRTTAAVVAVGLFAFIDLVTGHGLDWAQWPVLALAALIALDQWRRRGGRRSR